MFSISRLIGVHVSGRVYEAIKTISSQSIFYEKILSVQKASKYKITISPPLRSFYAQKNVAFVVLCSFVGVFVGWFWFDLRFCSFKIFS